MTTYNIRLGMSGSDVHLQIVLPATCEDPSFIVVRDEADRDLLGVQLSHGDVTVGDWPDGEEWVERVRVDNPLGTDVVDGEPEAAKVLLVSTPESRAQVLRHPAQDDDIALARAVGVLVEDEVPQTQ